MTGGRLAAMRLTAHSTMRRCVVRVRFVGGFTLIEVLVAVCVLAIGILGAVAAQTTALRTRQASRLMSDGVQLASAFADRMRANTAQMRAPDPANPYLQVRYDGAVDGVPAPSRLCFAGSQCSSAELASFDIHELTLALHQGFPGGRVAICRDARMWDEARAALAWECEAGAAAPVVIKLGWRARPQGSNDGGAAREAAPAVAIVVAGDFT